MSLYAQTPARRSRQVLGDVAVVVWIVVWVAVGRAVSAAVGRLADPALALEDAGRSLEEGLRGAAAGVARVPLLGENLRQPFDAAGEAARTLAVAGVEAQAAVGRAALLTGLAVAGWPILLGAGAWLVHRLRWARRAAAVRRLLSAPGGADLLALRALAAAPVRRLAAVGPDPAGAWRRGDPTTVAALAALTLDDVGVRPPAVGGAAPVRGGTPPAGSRPPSP